MEMRYAGFWKRVAALLIDTVLTMLVGGLIGAMIGLVIAVSAKGVDIQSAAMEGVFNLIGLVIGWVYFASMESSSYQATLGKMALGIRVCDLDGNRVSFGRASGRHFAKILSAVLLLVGYVMAAFTAKKQGLHDMIASTLVIDKV